MEKLKNKNRQTKICMPLLKKLNLEGNLTKIPSLSFDTERV